MKNFLIFIFFSVVLYLLSLLVVSWDNENYTGNTNDMESFVGSQKKMFAWNDDFHFPGTLYSRAKYIPPVVGRTFYVDPLKGSMQNDGSATAPWRTLEEVFSNNLIQHYAYKNTPYKLGGEKILVNPEAPVKGGDAIVLLDGDHGRVGTPKGGFYVESGSFLTIKAGKGCQPVLSGLELISSSYLYFQGIDFVRTGNLNNHTSSIININGHAHYGLSSDIIISNCVVRTAGNSEEWSAADWKKRAGSGIAVKADDIVVRDCRLENVAIGIGLTGDNSIVAGNNIHNFCADGLRGNGSNLVFEDNKIIGSYKVDGNHDDGFQSFLTDGYTEYHNVVIQRNTFIQSIKKNRKLRGSFQGIGCFDGPYKDWKIIGNTVITDHWHGIVLMGGVDCVIEDNIVLPLNYGSREGPPWISLTESKKGDAPVGCLVRNNRAMNYKLSKSVSDIDNIIIRGQGEVESLIRENIDDNKLLESD